MVDYDLDDRLACFAANVVEYTEALPNTRTGNHIANQLLRSGTAPLAHHGEAQAAESRRDFIHKMRLALKELRETSRWLDLAKRRAFEHKTDLLGKLLVESDELSRIFNASIRTALVKQGSLTSSRLLPPFKVQSSKFKVQSSAFSVQRSTPVSVPPPSTFPPVSSQTAVPFGQRSCYCRPLFHRFKLIA